MGYVIEDKKQFFSLRTSWKPEAYVSVITNNDQVHPNLARPIALYIHPIKNKHGYVVSIEHNEGRQTDMPIIQDMIASVEKVYVRDKIKFLSFFKHKNVVDLNIIKSYNHHKEVEKDSHDKIKNWYEGKDVDFIDINLAVPLLKHYELENERFNSLKEYMGEDADEGFDFLNNDCSKVFTLLSKSPVGIDTEKFVNHYKIKNKEFSIRDNKVFGYYNIHTTTGRPSNSFNNVNFLAIPKKGEIRDSFRPINDRFLELDFDGYHIRLVADIIGFELGEESAHVQLAKMYNPGQEVTDEMYKKAKQTNFEALYGKIPKEYEHLEFYKKMISFRESLWKEFQKRGKITVPKSNRTFFKSMEDVYPSKLFNYYIQSLETGRNVQILKNVLLYLHKCKTFIALYTYDSIILDFSLEDGKEIIENIASLMSEKGKYPVHIKVSEDLNF